jgi:aspartate 1-decarboxylase
LNPSANPWHNAAAHEPALPARDQRDVSAVVLRVLRKAAGSLFAFLLAIAASLIARNEALAAPPSYRASGTFTALTGAITPPYPATMAAYDVCLLAVESENQAISLTTANGFVEVPTWSPQSAGTPATNPASRLALFWKRTVGGDAAPTVADSGNHTTGQIHCFSGVTPSGNPWDTGAGGNDGGANDTSATIPGSTTTVANTLVVLITSTSFNGTSTAQCSGWTNASLTSLTERTDNTNTAGLGGGHCMATGEKASAGAYATTTVTLANTSYKGAISLALIPAEVTTLATGTDPAAATVAPGASATDVDQFTLQTSSGTEAITSVTVNLSTSSGVGRLAITDNAGTELGFTTSPVTGSNTITVSGMTATTTLTTFKVRVTPLSHAAMPAPPGAAYSITAPVTAWAGPNQHAGSDTNPNALTIDNLSPGNVTGASATGGSSQVMLSWTNPGDADLQGVIVLRNTVAVADTPVEGTTYVVGNTIGTSVVACVVTAPTATCTDTGLTNGTQYHYLIFAKDTNGNYSQTGVVPTGSPVTPGTCYAVATANWNVTTTWASTSGGTAGTCSGSGNIPDSGTLVFIGETATARTVTIPAGYAASAASVTLGNSPAVANSKALTLAAASSTLTVGGNVTIYNPSNNTNTNSLNVDAGTVSVGGNLALNGTSTNNSRIARVSITTGTLTISGGLTYTAANAARAQIVMNTGAGVLNLAGALTVNTTGTLTAGTLGSTFNYNGTAAQTIQIGVSSIVYNYLHANNTNASGATLSAAVTATNVTGNLRVQSGTLSNGGFSITGGAGDTFEVASGATFRMTGTGGFPTGFSTFSLGATSTVRYLQTNAQTVSAQTYGHLEISPTANSITHTFAAGTTTVAGNLTLGNGTNTGVVVTAAPNSTTLDVNGNVDISANTTLVAHASNPMTVGGNWTRTGSFTQGTGTVSFDGGTAQAINGTTTFNNLTIANTSGGVSLGASHTIDGTLTLSSGTFAVGTNTLTLNGPTIAGTPTNLSTTSSSSLVFGGSSAGVSVPSSVAQLDGLTVNNANGITLSGSPTVNGTLTFNGGDISTGANTLTIGSAGSVFGAGTSSHLVGNLAKAYSAAGSFTYPLGDGTNYTPITVNMTALGTSGNLTAAVTNTDHPNTTAGSSGIDSSKSVNRYWTLKNPTLSGTADLTLNYIGGNPVDNDAGSTASSFIVRRGATCSGSGAGRACTGGWTTLTASGTPTTTQAAASGVSIASGAAEADVVAGEAASTKFSREKEFIYSRELY